jgi:hypothetical protein
MQASNRVLIHRLNSDDLDQIRRQYPSETRVCPACEKSFELGDLIVRIEISSVVHLYHERCFKSSVH